MRLRYVLAPVLVSALIFSVLGYYARTLRDDSDELTVTNRTVEEFRPPNYDSGTHQYCVFYHVVNESQSKCFVMVGDPPPCWAEARIGDGLPESCR